MRKIQGILDILFSKGWISYGRGWIRHDGLKFNQIVDIRNALSAEIERVKDEVKADEAVREANSIINK